MTDRHLCVGRIFNLELRRSSEHHVQQSFRSKSSQAWSLGIRGSSPRFGE